MTDKINPSVASTVSNVIEERKARTQMRCSNTKCGNEYPVGVMGPNVCAECGESMKTELIEEERGQVEGADDVLVAIGDLSEAKLTDITTGKNYEAIAMDYIATFNGAVTQGVAPLKALMAMVQATAIVMGLCIRAGLRMPVAFGLIKYIADACTKAKDEVKIITKPN